MNDLVFILIFPGSLLLLGFIFLLLGAYKKPKIPIQVDLRIPGKGGAVPSHVFLLSFGIILISIGLFIFIYPLGPLAAYIISGAGIIVALFIRFYYVRVV